MNLNQVIDCLKTGQSVAFRPHGNSMTPKINSGDLVEVRPYGEAEVPQVGDMAICIVNGRRIGPHLVTAVRGPQFQISNNHGHHNGWTTRAKMFGKVVSVSA